MATMEASVSASVSLAMRLHCFPPNAITTTTTTNSSSFPVFKFRASTEPLSIARESPVTRHIQVSKFSAKKTKKVKPFAEKDAFPESLPLHNKNPSAICKDIKKFARQDKLREALTILDYMDQRGIPVNATTFSSLIAACIRAKSLSAGKEIHTHIRINGLEKNEFLSTKLVHMYTSCGSLKDARQVFNECPTATVYPWNALLRGTVVSGKRQYVDVLSTFSEMRALGIELNEYSFSCVIKSFAGASALFQGLKTHGLLIKKGFIDSSMLKSSLIDMYFKCGKTKLAHKLFEESAEKDIVAWGAMISGFAHNRLNWEALEYVRKMVDEEIKPNSVIITMVLPAIGELCALRLGQEVHAYVVKTKSYTKQIPIQSALIHMYCKCRDMSSGRRVFYSSMERNTVCWTALMSGYANNGRLEQALRSIIWMQQEGFRPDVVTIATVLPICAELRTLKQGKELHAYALKHWFLPNVAVISSLMVMYSKCGIVEYSTKLFDGTKGRNVILWTVMIDSYVENGYIYEALDVIRSMQLSKHRPDSVAMARMLSVCSELKLMILGKEIHGQLLRRDIKSVFLSAELIRMYGICGACNKAKLVFDAVPVKGVMTWTVLIKAYGHNTLFQDAISLFHQMKSKGFSPNHVTFEVVLSICESAGFVDDACRIFSLMYGKYKIKPSKEHCSIMIRLLTRYGRLDDAQRFQEMSSFL